MFYFDVDVEIYKLLLMLAARPGADCVGAGGELRAARRPPTVGG